MHPPKVTRRSRSKYVAVFAVVAVMVLVLDQGTKAWAKQTLSDGNIIEVIPHALRFVLVHNPGASLGFGSGHTWIISVLAIVACVLLAFASAQTDSHEWAVMLGAAFGGAAGNLIDRVAYAQHGLDGRVVDFIDYGWSVGNVADIFLTLAGIGVVALVLRGVAFRSGRDGRKAIMGDEPDGEDTDGDVPGHDEPVVMPRQASQQGEYADGTQKDVELRVEHADNAGTADKDSEVNGQGSEAR